MKLPTGHSSVVAAIVVLLLLLNVQCQSSDKLREDTTVDIDKYGEIKTAITTNKTKAFLQCGSGDMVVTIDFNDPFFGVIFANRDPQSPCTVEGNGGKVYTIRLPLQGCGTREDPKRTFINDIVVRFRKGLIIDEDEVKTIICRYDPPVPPPVVPLTPLPPLPSEPTGVVAKPKRLTEAEIYVIICFLLFLGLLLLGVGLAYYCLKKRNIKIVRKKRAISSAPASEITKLSGSTMGTLSAFDGFRIPRATAHSTSGSEAALLTHGDHSDTIPSDYPSESPSSTHSDMEEVETRRDTTLVSETSTVMEDHYRYDNRAFVRDDAIQRLEATPTPPPMPRPLTTIYEQDDYASRTDEYDQSVLSARRLLQHQQMPPVYAKIRKKQQETLSSRQETTMTSEELDRFTQMRFAPAPALTAPSIPENEHRSMSEFDERPSTWAPRVHAATMSESRSVSEYLEEVTRREPPPQRAPHYDEVDSVVRSTTSDILEPPAIYAGPPATTRHTIDDRYLTTITETQTREDVTKHTKTTTHSHVREPPPPPPPPPPHWDVTIRTYPPLADTLPRAPTVTTDSETDQWEQLSYISERPQSLYDPSEPPVPPPAPPPPPPNWDVLIRVLKPQAPSVLSEADDDETASNLSDVDRERWRRIITTDTTLRTMLQEAHTAEEFESIRHDERYEKLFEPQKWDVIIRTLVEPPEPERAQSDTSSTISDAAPSIASSGAGGYGGNYQHNNNGGGYAPRRYRKKTDQADNRSRRSSLPPVYEYEDFDFGEALTPTTRSRRTSHSSEYDLQSMGEEESVRFDGVEHDSAAMRGRLHGADVESLWSADSGDALGYLESRRQTARSIAERSTTEIVEDIPRVFEGQHRPLRDRRSLLRSSSELVEMPDVIERDSVTEPPYGGHQQQHYSERSTYRHDEQYYSASREAPNADRNHRHLERSSTEILVNSPLLRMAGQGPMHADENYSLPETEISDYMR